MNNKNLESVPAISKELFVLPYTAEWYFRDLDDADAGRLIKALLAYHNRGVRRKYKVSNKVGIYFTQIVWDTEEMLGYHQGKGSR